MARSMYLHCAETFNMQKEEVQFQKRLEELASLSYQRQIPVYTHFLNRNELHILHTVADGWKHLFFQTSGGYEFAERQMAVFTPDALLFEVNYPFTALCVRPSMPKFAEDLTHRDYLGAILNLGIDRNRLGDLIVRDRTCFLFCENTIADFLIQECTRVRHTNVIVSWAADEQIAAFTKPQFQELRASVASLRLDAVLAAGFHTSRSVMNQLIYDGFVFVNGRLTQNSSHLLKDGDVISARGYGKFIFETVLSETKKGRLMIRLMLFL